MARFTVPFVPHQPEWRRGVDYRLATPGERLCLGSNEPHATEANELAAVFRVGAPSAASARERAAAVAYRRHHEFVDSGFSADDDVAWQPQVTTAPVWPLWGHGVGLARGPWKTSKDWPERYRNRP